MFVLKPSKIHGVGVFTLEDIATGQLLDLWGGEDWRLITNPPEEVKYFCIETKEGFYCPLDFRRISLGWYLNHSETPNAIASKNEVEEFYAGENIAAGEEITIDYNKLD